MDGFSNPDDWWISHPDGFADAFPDDRSQWHDTDDDGLGIIWNISMVKHGVKHGKETVA